MAIYRETAESTLPPPAGSEAEGLRIRVVDSISFIDPVAWNRLLHPGQFFIHGYLSALENAGLDCRWYYALAETDSQLQAVSFGYRFLFPIGAGLKIPVFIGGSPVNVGLPFAVRDPSAASKLFIALQKALFDAARSAGAWMFVLRDYSKNEISTLAADLASALEALVMPLHECADLVIEWPDFDAFLMQFRSNYRKSIRRDMNQIKKAGFKLVVGPGPELKPSATTLHRLWLNLYHKYRDADQICLTEAYFQKMIDQPHSLVFLLYKDTKLLAYDLCFALGDILESVYCGLDPTSIGKLPVHRFMGYEIIRHAIAGGFRRINFGISNEENKQRMGCGLRMQYAFVRPVWNFANMSGLSHLVARMFGTRRHHRPKRVVFKTEIDKPSIPPPTHASKKIASVVIIGAGIGGLGAAAVLAREGVPVQVIEQHQLPGGLCTTRAFDGVDGHLVGCNLFSTAFFSTLDREIGVRLPHIPAPVSTYCNTVMVRSDAGWFAALKAFGRLGLTPAAALGLIARLAAVAWQRSYRRMDYGEWLERVIRKPALIDLLLQPANLLGISAHQLQLGKAWQILGRADQTSYPMPGIASVGQAMARKVARGNRGVVRTGIKVDSILVDGGRVQGIIAGGKFIASDTVVANMTLNAAAALANWKMAKETSQSGMAVALVMLLLRPTLDFPEGVHTFSFVAPDLGGQLRALSEGRMPKDWSFDLVVPELLPGVRRTTKKYLQASIFFNWPRGMSEDRPMERAWDYVLDVLERHFPGFGRAILWFQRLTPVAYKRTVGLSSVTCPSLSGFQGNDLLQQVPGITGLYAVGGGVHGANSLSALRSGLACGRHIIRKGV